ncbi:MAG: hypothetical protein ABEJ73_09935 [Haloplanus sp.]
MASPSDAADEDRRADPPADSIRRRSRSFFDWYHHALAVAYSVSAAVSSASMPLDRLAIYFGGSLLGAYVVLGVLTIAWRRLVPRLL